jgi:hypothetical protein
MNFAHYHDIKFQDFKPQTSLSPIDTCDFAARFFNKNLTFDLNSKSAIDSELISSADATTLRQLTPTTSRHKTANMLEHV